MADRNFNVTWTHKAFSGPVRGVAYVYDLLNHRKQYVIAAGEEAVRSSVESKSQASESYVIKVSICAPENLIHVCMCMYNDFRYL